MPLVHYMILTCQRCVGSLVSPPETDVDDDDGEDTEEDTDARNGDEYGQGDARGKGTCVTETRSDLEQSASNTANYGQHIHVI